MVEVVERNDAHGGTVRDGTAQPCYLPAEDRARVSATSEDSKAGDQDMPIAPGRLVKVGPPRLPPRKPTWESRSIIFRLPGGNIEAIDGWCYATLGVHVTPEWIGDDTLATVTLTHIPSRKAVVRVDSTEDAIAIAERLWDKCGEAFVRPGEDVDFTKVPQDVIDWVRECMKQRRHVQ